MLPNTMNIQLMTVIKLGRLFMVEYGQFRQTWCYASHLTEHGDDMRDVVAFANSYDMQAEVDPR